MRKDKEERTQRQREERIHRQEEERMQREQEAAQPEIHGTEETALRARIAYLEDQLAQRQVSSGSSLSAPSERLDEKEEPEVVAVVEVRHRVQAEDVRPKAEAVSKRPTEEEELTIRRKAIEVLLVALDDAVAQGILTREGYQTKRSKYRRELRRIEKGLKTSS